MFSYILVGISGGRTAVAPDDAASVTDRGQPTLCRILPSRVGGCRDRRGRAAEVAQAPVGRLRIAVPVAFGTERVAPLLATYLDCFPDMRAELVLGNRKVDLIEEGFDLAFRIGVLEDDWLVAHPLAPYRLMLAAAPSYLAHHGHPETPADLGRHRLIGFAQFGADECWALIGPDGEYRVQLPPLRLRINHAAALRRAAVAGHGIILQSRVTLDDDLASGRLVPVLPDYAPEPRPLTLVRLPDRRATAGFRAFLDMAVSAFGNG